MQPKIGKIAKNGGLGEISSFFKVWELLLSKVMF
jgi:hypothetical protein